MQRGRTMLLSLEARPQASWWMPYLSPVIAMVLTLLGGLIVFALLGKNPIDGFRLFFFSPMRDLYGVSELFLKATPLMLIGVGLAVGFRAGVWNVGAEGQYILGAISATGVALRYQDVDSFWILPAMAGAGIFGGALWAAIPALLRTRFRANEILVSLMLVYVAQLLASWLVYGPWKDPAGFNFPQTKVFSDSALLPILFSGTRLNAGILLALAGVGLGYVFLQRSFVGFQLRVAGLAKDAARYAGISSERTVWIGMAAGGAMAGLTGMLEVAGPVGQLTTSISSNYGFAAIIVAFVGRLHPVGIFFASLMMALLYLGGEQAQQFMSLPSSISNVFQGMLLFFLLGTNLFVDYRLRFKFPWLRTTTCTAL
jgi:general nucleoside transport system permease protein